MILYTSLCGSFCRLSVFDNGLPSADAHALARVLNAGAVFLRAAVTAGTNVLIMFGGENNFKS